MFDRRNSRAFWLAGLLAALWMAPSADAQTAAAAASSGVGAAPAALIETTSHDADGRLVIRAQPLPERIVLDGRLDEPVYAAIQPASGFVQAEPRYSEPATEQTQVWVFFDDRAIYFGFRCFDSDPAQWSSLDLRRDSQGFALGESVSVALDTFHDRRNGFGFGVNPNGGLSDSANTNERDSNRDWNTIWDARTGRFDGGWTVEVEIPFKSLRYAPGDQIWGINVRRTVRWKNEISYLSPVPQSGQFSAQFSLYRFSSAATLVGLKTPPESRLLEIKPYVVSSLNTDLNASEPYSNDPKGSVGFDVKFGLTRGLTADFTYNTDFAQVEEDEQQVNLTRFSLFFPEKREFFLEGQGIFAFGGFAQRRSGNPGEVPMPFFSRRIGLDGKGHAVPILGGGRVTGRVGKYSVGIVNIQTKQDESLDQAATNFSVLRLRRDILRRSNIGLLVVNRSANGHKLRGNQAYGIDGVFSFYQNLNINTFFAGTHTPELRGDDRSYRAQLEYNADRYGLVLENMLVGKNFNPETGYVRRKDIRRTVAEGRFSPRPRSSRVVRKYEYSLGLDRYVRVSDGVLETQVLEGAFTTEFESSDRFGLTYTDNIEDLAEPDEVFSGIEVPRGRYAFKNLNASYTLGTHHLVSGNVSYDYGGFFGGRRHTIGFVRGRTEPIANLFVEPGISINWVDIPQGRFVAKVLNSRIIYTFTPRTFLGALLQYGSEDHVLSVNARFRWEYRPGSDLFVVYNDGRDTLGRGFPRIETRSLTVKLTRFFRS